MSLITFTGCNNDEYLVDGGKANPYYDGNIWEYLNNHPYHEDLFGDLTQIISLAGLEDICKMKILLYLHQLTSLYGEV